MSEKRKKEEGILIMNALKINLVSFAKDPHGAGLPAESDLLVMQLWAAVCLPERVY